MHRPSLTACEYQIVRIPYTTSSDAAKDNVYSAVIAAASLEEPTAVDLISAARCTGMKDTSRFVKSRYGIP